MGACTKYADNERCVSGRITEGIQASTHNVNKVQKVPFFGTPCKVSFLVKATEGKSGKNHVGLCNGGAPF